MKSFVNQRALPYLTQVPMSEEIPMSEEESLNIRSSEKTKVSVIAVIFDSNIKIILNEEYIHNPQLAKLVTKMPSVSLLPGENWKTCLQRRLKRETGLEPDSMELGFVRNSSNSHSNFEEHIKIYVLIPFVKGIPQTKGSGNVLCTFWGNPFENTRIAKAQEIELPSCENAIKQYYLRTKKQKEYA